VTKRLKLLQHSAAGAFFDFTFNNNNIFKFTNYLLKNDKLYAKVILNLNISEGLFMKRGTTLFLKAAVILIGIPVLALCIFLVPEIANFAAELYPEMTYIQFLVYLDLYASAIPFYIALYQAFKLLGYIDKNKAFSELSVRVLKNIKFCAITISSVYVLGMPLFYLIAEKDDAPGIIVIGLIIIFASMVIAVFAAVLQRLLTEAIELKSENDLTV
jgi:hypothetical protein